MALKKFAGLIDPHVHIREPGATQKEDFYTASRAAVAGGFTFILDMPNNPIPTVSLEALEDKIALADKKAVCDISFHYGTNGKNMNTFKDVWDNPRVFGLKIYCNHTTGDLLVHEPEVKDQIFKAWESDKPILVHAEADQLAIAILKAEKYNRCLHDCHISKKVEVEMVRDAKKKGLSITAGVCPHHLYMTDKDVEKMDYRATMKPPLSTKEDQDAFWEGLSDGTIDIVETDHAPHLLSEKEAGTARFGVPGLETALGLMLLAVKDGKLKEDDIKRLMYSKPKEIFNIPDQPDTHIEFDPDETYILEEETLETKCKWSPFNGWELPGKVRRVVLRGKEVWNLSKTQSF